MQKYRIFGSEMSPYSVKVRAYFRYKQIPHEWIIRAGANRAEFDSFAKIPLIPLVISPLGYVMQDSTPIIEHLEKEFPLPSIEPESVELVFLSNLLEEFGDEWANKLMFHTRWWHETDRLSASRILGMNLEYGMGSKLEAKVQEVSDRMVGRRGFVGSSSETAELIEGYLKSLVFALEDHLQDRLYLLGGRPCLGDFGIASEIYELSSDPTGAGLLRARAPNTLAWGYRMLDPRNDGPFEGWESLSSTLIPLLKEVGELFLPWSSANKTALELNQPSFEVDLRGKKYAQKPQKYHAKSLSELQNKFTHLTEKGNLEEILEKTNCLDWVC